MTLWFSFSPVAPTFPTLPVVHCSPLVMTDDGTQRMNLDIHDMHLSYVMRIPIGKLARRHGAILHQFPVSFLYPHIIPASALGSLRDPVIRFSSNSRAINRLGQCITQYMWFHVGVSLVATSSPAIAAVPFHLNLERHDSAASTSLTPLEYLDAALSEYPSSIIEPIATQSP